MTSGACRFDMLEAPARATPLLPLLEASDRSRTCREERRRVSELLWDEIDRRAVDTARVLAADAVEKVGNGHPGTAMSLAPAAYLLYQRVLRHDPTDVDWLGRDRFILSAGHSSLTQYVQLYLGGFGLELDDLKALRTWGSLTPGHPEYGHTKGVEITTGPLGQGLASAVGFAYAARYERGLFDPEAAAGTSPFDHHIYVIAGDGDLQEGITAEAGSLAGHQQLGNLIAIYDSNQISIEDDTNVAFTEDVQKRYEAYGWHVQTVDWKKTGEYVEDVAELFAAIEAAKGETDKPSLIILKTIIGWPSPGKQNTGKIHGSALGSDELAATKKVLGFDPEQSFVVADDVIAHTRALAERAAETRAAWQESFDAWAAANPERKALLDRLEAAELPADLDAPTFEAGKEVSTRAASGQVINALAAQLPELWGGSADLAESNLTTIKDAKSFIPAEWSTHEWSGDPYGRVLHFGIREHAMGAIVNGIKLHGPTRPFGGTFLIFSDYMRPAVRLAALMDIPSVFVWTHDSVALGEDGPTHQPIEQLAQLRGIPGMITLRPADANETAEAWKVALSQTDRPSCIVLSRQPLPTVDRKVYGSAEGTSKGAYVLADTEGKRPEVILIATGSEVSLCVDACKQLQSEGIATRVVSMPSWELFEMQDAAYRESVLPAAVTARVVVEQGGSLGWDRYVGQTGAKVVMHTFGASAPIGKLQAKFGFTVENVVKLAREQTKARSTG